MNEGIIRNIVRFGVVSSINEKNGTVRVLFEDKDNMISDELPLLSFEYNMPSIKDQVLCIFLPNGLQQGFCLGSFYSEINLPLVEDKNIYYKKFDDSVSIQYNKDTKQLTINSTNKIIINSNVQVNGNINATGTVTASNIVG